MKLYQSSSNRILAVLGPTNTGKTHLALERMLGHSSGIMGFPLRLLARENYDKAVRLKGRDQIALITGEEKIVPAAARYFLCTVESMPVDLPTAFIGVDEIQLCADPERGHIFTDRLLNARGLEETMFMGSSAMESLLRRLIPDIRVETRSRFSKLSYSGRKKINRLPSKTAIVAFSVNEVYSIAELVRRQKGGAAVVLGALSPRARNAQIGLYQSGEVEYIVATDAIGMGLNMDVNHVAFAGLNKFDGRKSRMLTVPETAQIAGRAGRYMNDGTFGTTADAPPLDAKSVEQLEAHEFAPIRRIFWRNSNLGFTSINALLCDLRLSPPKPEFILPRPAEDERALEFLSQNCEISKLAKGQRAVEALWDVCGIPDFAKTMTDVHRRLLGQIYLFLMDGDGLLPIDWVNKQIQRLNRADGDIDALSQRIAGIRTWAYIANRRGWLPDQSHWRELTREVEDKLSDALHNQLTLRFVDRRTSILTKRLKDKSELIASVNKAGDVMVEGHGIGCLEGFRFVADKADGKRAAKAVNAAAIKTLASEINRRVETFRAAPNTEFILGERGEIHWNGASIARLKNGRSIIHPTIKLLSFDLLEANHRTHILARLNDWLDAKKRELIRPLERLESENLTGAARGLAFQLIESLGSLPRKRAAEQIKNLGQNERRTLRRMGVKIERASVYIPALLKPISSSFCATLWVVFHSPETLPTYPRFGRVSVDKVHNSTAEFYEAAGYRVCGDVAVRLDILERLAALAWEASKKGTFQIDAAMLATIGRGKKEASQILTALGYSIKQGKDGTIEASRQTQKMHSRKKTSRKDAHHSKARKCAGGIRINPNSPFAKLNALKVRE